MIPNGSCFGGRTLEATSFRASARQPSTTDTLSGEVRLAATEGLEERRQPPGNHQWGRNRVYFPSYTCAFGGKMIPLEVELHQLRAIWRSYHPR
jgi:hypothetical protein